MGEPGQSCPRLCHDVRLVAKLAQHSFVVQPGLLLPELLVGDTGVEPGASRKLAVGPARRPFEERGGPLGVPARLQEHQTLLDECRLRGGPRVALRTSATPNPLPAERGEDDSVREGHGDNECRPPTPVHALTPCDSVLTCGAVQCDGPASRTYLCRTYFQTSIWKGM